MTTHHTPPTLEVCDYCGEPFDDAHPEPWRFEIGPFVGKVVHQGLCDIALFDDDNRARFERRPRWQQRLIRRMAGPPPWER